jgi:hypothetical protein
MNYHIAFRLEFEEESMNEEKYEYKIYFSKEPFTTETVQELNNKMTTTTRIRWMEMFRNCNNQRHFTTIFEQKEYYIQKTRMT